MKFKWIEQPMLYLLNSAQFKTWVLSFLGSSIAKAVGLKAWLIGLLFEYGLEKALIPMFNALLLEGYLVVDKAYGKQTAKKVRDAVDEKDIAKWMDSISRL